MPALSLKITARLILSFVLVLLVTISITAVALWRLHAGHALTDYLVTRKLGNQQLAADWLGAVNLNGVRALAIAKSDSLELEQYFADKMKSGDTAAADFGAALRASASTPQERQELAAIVEAGRRVDVVRAEVFRLKAGGKTQQVEKQVLTAMEPVLIAYQKAIQTLLTEQKIQASALVAESEAMYRRSVGLLIGLGLTGILFGALSATILIRGIVRPLKRAIGIAAEVASGRLDTVVADQRQDEIGALLRSLSNMTQSLAGTVSKVRHEIAKIDATADEMAHENAELAARSEAQARALADVAVAVGQLTESVQRNTGSARHADRLAVAASHEALQGGREIAQLAFTMHHIVDSAAQMGQIIGVIDGIAFQTNILALNAAVEAARAGTQGRGFAIVAAEVRSLAQRSTAAAKEIKDLIATSVTQAAAGNESVLQSGRTIAALVESSRQVTQVVSEISKASRHQERALQQVNYAVTDIDCATRDNLALVEQVGANANALHRQSGTLRAAIDFFVGDAVAAAAVSLEKLSATISTNTAGAHAAFKPARVGALVRRERATPALAPSK